MKVAAIIVCAGKGARFGSQDKSKLLLSGKPLFYHSFKIFSRINQITQIVLVLQKKHILLAKKTIGAKDLDRYNVSCICGGVRRQDSVYNGLKAVDKSIDSLIIHDGARPGISKKLTLRLLKELRKSEAVITGLRARDTLKTVDSNSIVKTTLDRKNIVSIQTPQGFRKDLLLRAYKKFSKKNMFDDAQLIEILGKKVKVIPGEMGNFKITYPEDIIFILF